MRDKDRLKKQDFKIMGMDVYVNHDDCKEFPAIGTIEIADWSRWVKVKIKENDNTPTQSD